MALRVSLTMIVRDDEASLARCLASVAELADEIVIVDTGSADRTHEIAAAARDRHGSAARVYDFAWIDDFSAARNESLRHARGDWIFWMDGDDWLDEPNRQALARLFAGLADENAVYQMIHASPPAPDGGHPESAAPQDRLFRNLPAIRWEGRVHEQIALSASRSGAILKRTDIAILHSGYDDDLVRRHKIARNLRLLELQNAEQPNNPHTLFYLGMTYAMAERTVDAIPCLYHSLELLPPRSPFRPRGHLLLADCWRVQGDVRRARVLCQNALAVYPDDEGLRQLMRELIPAE
ncbi:MAG TPA: glycosyltransferase family 2 protein [Pirellulales bacterium]|nr:glycosyltransferase family 2 protein [Pirellulales bacterium]